MALVKKVMLMVIGVPAFVWGIAIIVQLFMRIYLEFKVTFEILMNKKFEQNIGDGAASAALFIMMWVILIMVISILASLFSINLPAEILKTTVNFAMLILAAYIFTLAIWCRKLKYALSFLAVHEILRKMFWYIW